MFIEKVFDPHIYNDDQWREHASCKNMSPSLFYPEQTRNIPKIVKQTCAECPVRQQCVTFAVNNHERYGIWGGMGYRARLHYVKKLRNSDRTPCV